MISFLLGIIAFTLISVFYGDRIINSVIGIYETMGIFASEISTMFTIIIALLVLITAVRVATTIINNGRN